MYRLSLCDSYVDFKIWTQDKQLGLCFGIKDNKYVILCIKSIVGETVSFECEVNCDPKPVYRWTSDSKNFQGTYYKRKYFYHKVFSLHFAYRIVEYE